MLFFSHWDLKYARKNIVITFIIIIIIIIIVVVVVVVVVVIIIIIIIIIIIESDDNLPGLETCWEDESLFTPCKLLFMQLLENALLLKYLSSS